MMPKDTNSYGTIFGGVILSLIDQAGFDEARQHGIHRWVTVAFGAVEFKRPVFCGDVVSLYTSLINQGTTSLEIKVEVWADRYNEKKMELVTNGSLTMVSVDADGKPIPWSEPSTLSPGDPS
jgi:acyl-CoA thioesterase YciA